MQLNFWKGGKESYKLLAMTYEPIGSPGFVYTQIRF